MIPYSGYQSHTNSKAETEDRSGEAEECLSERKENFSFFSASRSSAPLLGIVLTGIQFCGSGTQGNGTLNNRATYIRAFKWKGGVKKPRSILY